MEVTCQRCGKTITRRMKANIWDGEIVVCIDCFHSLRCDVARQEVAYRIAGKARTPWLVHDAQNQFGPYATEELIEFLRHNRVDWSWNIWREGMGKWVSAAQLFTIPELTGGRLELRDHGQGDGTYRYRG